jgi:hypothetical protein
MYNNAYDIYLRHVCINNNLNALKCDFQNGVLTKNYIIRNDNDFDGILNFCMVTEKVKIIEWLFDTFLLTKEEMLGKHNRNFLIACGNGKLRLCEWFVSTFKLTKNEVSVFNNYPLYMACKYQKFDIISFLCNTFGFTEEDTKDFINEIPEKDREKIFECLIPPIGSFTKAAQIK